MGQRLQLPFHVQRFNQGATRHGHHKAEYHIDRCHPDAEDTGEQHQAAQVHHGGGNQEGEGHPQGQPRPREADENGDRRAGTEGRDGAQQRRDGIGPHPVEPPHDAAAALGREVTLNPGDGKDQHAEQHGDLDGIVQEKLHAAADAPGDVQPQGGEQVAHQPVEPLHAQHLILEKQPKIHWDSPFYHIKIF